MWFLVTWCSRDMEPSDHHQFLADMAIRKKPASSLALERGPHGLGIRALGVDEVDRLIDEPRTLFPRNKPQRGVRGPAECRSTGLQGHPQPESRRVRTEGRDLDRLTSAHPRVRVVAEPGRTSDFDALGDSVRPQLCRRRSVRASQAASQS